MKTFVYACLVVLCAVVVAQADELVKNGGFEYPYAYQASLPLCGATLGPTVGNWWCLAPSGFTDMEWIVEWANAAGSTGKLEFWRGLPPAPQNFYPQAGEQDVELDTNARDGSTNTNVRIYQSIATCPGASYALSYYYRSRFTDTPATFGVSVHWAGAQVASHTGVVSSWQNGSASLPGKFGLAKLEFVAGGSGDGVGMMLDTVSLTGPNPATPDACTTVNIKPYSDPNSINVCSSGTVPVTIWGSATFDVSTIDPPSLTLGGAMVNTAGKTGRYQCSVSDSGRPEIGPFDRIGLPDGYPDLTCHFETAAGMFSPAATTATVSMTVCQNGLAEGCTGKPSTTITATDAVRIVKDGCQ